MLFMLLKNGKRPDERQKNHEYADVYTYASPWMDQIIKSWKACVLVVVKCRFGGWVDEGSLKPERVG